MRQIFDIIYMGSLNKFAIVWHSFSSLFRDWIWRDHSLQAFFPSKLTVKVAFFPVNLEPSENENDSNEDQMVHFEIDIATCETQFVTIVVQFANVENQFALF